MITVGIPIFNGANTIKTVLDKLTLQRIPNLPVMVYDNQSTDGTIGLCSELSGRKYYANKIGKDNCTLNFNFFSGTHEPNHPYQNALRTRKLIAKIATTEYIFFLDSDVILPPNSLLTLLEEHKQGQQMFTTIKYEPDCDGRHNHIMFGASLWNRQDFLKLPDGYDPAKGCDCKYACDWAYGQGRSAKYHSWLMAYHCKQL